MGDSRNIEDKERAAKEKIPNAFELSMEKLQRASSRELQPRPTARGLIDRSQIHCDYLLKFQGQSIKRNQVLQHNLKLNEMRERVKTTLDYCNQSQHFVTMEKQNQKTIFGSGAHECSQQSQTANSFRFEEKVAPRPNSMLETYESWHSKRSSLPGPPIPTEASVRRNVNTPFTVGTQALSKQKGRAEAKRKSLAFESSRNQPGARFASRLSERTQPEQRSTKIRDSEYEEYMSNASSLLPGLAVLQKQRMQYLDQNEQLPKASEG